MFNIHLYIGRQNRKTSLKLNHSFFSPQAVLIRAQSQKAGPFSKLLVRPHECSSVVLNSSVLTCTHLYSYSICTHFINALHQSIIKTSSIVLDIRSCPFMPPPHRKFFLSHDGRQTETRSHTSSADSVVKLQASSTCTCE